MAPVEVFVGSATVAGSFSSEVVFSLFLLALLAIILLALCTNCGKQSFELQHDEVQRSPSSLIRVVKLEDALEARENPIINEIKNDEKEYAAEIRNGTAGVEMTGSVSPQAEPVFDSFKVPAGEVLAASILTAMTEEEPDRMAPSPDTRPEALEVPEVIILDPRLNKLETLNPPEEFSYPSLPEEVDLPVEPDQEFRNSHIYATIGENGSQEQLQLAEVDDSLPGLCESLAANDEPASLQEACVDVLDMQSLEEMVGDGLSDSGSSPMYAKVSRKKKCPPPPAFPPPEDLQEEEEEPSPPLPHRGMDG